MTDILIPLGLGSRLDNIELRYCLRSIEKHLSSVGRVWLVGEKPDWITGVQHVRATDQVGAKYRAENIWRKIMKGVEYVPYKTTGSSGDTLSNNFLFFNDDHFLLADYEADQFPYYLRGQLADTLVLSAGNHGQTRQIENTLQMLGECYDFDVHCPILYNKTILFRIATLLNLNKEWPDYGYCIKSLITNYQYPPVDSISKCHDLKFKDPHDKETIYRILKNKPWFSIGDVTLREGGMLDVLEELYPHKSKYEK